MTAKHRNNFPNRVILNFEAQAESVNPDDVLLKILDAVPEKAEA